MTRRKEAAIRKAAWIAALLESRVVRCNCGMSFTSFPTVTQAKEFVAQTVAQGFDAEIVAYDA